MPRFYSVEEGNAEELLARTGLLGLRALVYEPDEAQQLLALQDKEVSILNPDVQVIEQPPFELVESFLDIPGFQYVPVWITWEQPVAPFPDHVEERYKRLGRGKSRIKKRVDDYIRKVALSTDYGISAEIRQLSRKSWSDFYDNLYVPWIVNHKAAGFDYAGSDFAEDHCGESKVNSNFSLLLLRDVNCNNKLVGGSLLEDFDAGNTLKIKFAAFSREPLYRRLSLSYRAYYEAVKLAMKSDYRFISYGTEPNLYAAEGEADMITIGLHNFKTNLCFMPKVLDIPGYCESKLIRFLPRRWACERNFFFYRYNSSFQHQRILEVAYSGVYPSDTIFPAGVSVTDVTNEIC